MDYPPYTKSAEVYDAFYRSILDYPTLAIAVHGMIQARSPGATTLLEPACGTGLYLAELSEWYEVEGLDASADMLRFAGERLPGTPLHHADMAAFDLGRAFDAVICMFSSIGYVVTRERLDAAVKCFADHLVPGGVMILEPWFAPDAWLDDHLAAEAVESGEVAVSRTPSSIRNGRQVTMRFGFSVARADGEVETFVEDHPTGLFTHGEYSAALRAAGIEFDYDPDGLLGRGRYVGVKPVMI